MQRYRLAAATSILAIAAILASSCAPCSLFPIPGAEPEMEIGFWADDEAVPPGGCTMLHWEAPGAEGYPVILNGEEVPPFGEQEVCLEGPMTFELIVEAPGGPHMRAVTIHVEGEPPPGELPPEGGPEVIIFEVHPDLIPADGCAMLFWEVHPPEWEVIVDGEGVPPMGEREVCPGTTTNYVLAVPAVGQERMVTLRVEGEEPPPPGTPPPAPTTAPGASPQPTTPPSGPAATTAPSQPSPTQPAAPSGSDVRPSDLYPDNQPKGTIWVRVVNDGPQTVTNKKVRISGTEQRSTLTTPPSASGSNILPKEYTIGNLAPGQQQNINLGWSIDLTQYGYQFTVTVEAVGFTDPNTGNNTYSESFQGIPPTATPWAVIVTVLPITPPAGDLVLEDAFLSADKAQLILRVGTTGSLTGSFEYNVVDTASGSVLKQGSFTIPTGSQAFWTGWKPPSGKTVKVTIDPRGLIWETNESNNSATRTF